MGTSEAPHDAPDTPIMGALQGCLTPPPHVIF